MVWPWSSIKVTVIEPWLANVRGRLFYGSDGKLYRIHKVQGSVIHIRRHYWWVRPLLLGLLGVAIGWLINHAALWR